MRRRKRPTPKPGLDRPYNGGSWTAARFRSFVVSTLRGARWPQRYEAIRLAFVEHGINPKTGRKCKLHRCAGCRQLFPQNKVQADHRDPVIGPEGFVSWDVFIQRLFIEAEGYDVLCHDCHKRKTLKERFNLEDHEIGIRQQVIDFGKLSADKQKKRLIMIGITPLSTGAARQVQYYTHLCNEHPNP